MLGAALRRAPVDGFVFDRIAVHVYEEREAVLLRHDHRASIHHFSFQCFPQFLLLATEVDVDLVVIEDKSPGVFYLRLNVPDVLVYLDERAARVLHVEAIVGVELGELDVLADHFGRCGRRRQCECRLRLTLLIGDPEGRQYGQVMLEELQLGYNTINRRFIVSRLKWDCERAQAAEVPVVVIAIGRRL